MNGLSYPLPPERNTFAGRVPPLPMFTLGELGQRKGPGYKAAGTVRQPDLAERLANKQKRKLTPPPQGAPNLAPSQEVHESLLPKKGEARPMPPTVGTPEGATPMVVNTGFGGAYGGSGNHYTINHNYGAGGYGNGGRGSNGRNHMDEDYHILHPELQTKFSRGAALGKQLAANAANLLNGTKSSEHLAEARKYKI